jgi:hypothetical protein
MDVDEPKGPIDPSVPLLAIETMLGYARSHWVHGRVFGVKKG